MNAIQNSSNTHPLYQPINWCFKKWEDLTFSSPISSHRLLKITALVIIVLIGIVGVLKMRQSNQMNIQEKNKTIESLGPSKQPAIRCETYTYWDTLNNRVSVTEKHLQGFLSYQYEESDQTALEAHAENIKFFYGNCDADSTQGSKDLGWGCAWRSIQTGLSSFSIFYTFNSLYQRYKLGSNQSEWAEPGYGKRIGDEDHISSELYLYKKGAGTQKTPTEWCTKIDSFAGFT